MAHAVEVEPGLGAAGVEELEGAAEPVVGGLLVVLGRAGSRDRLRRGRAAQRFVVLGATVAVRIVPDLA
ncbi:MAG: hypothetical protein F4Z84_05690 [Gammaproteobacteria bacterium]|nr:hypothetical protein [Gammaproteobacteria bacterium]